MIRWMKAIVLAGWVSGCAGTAALPVALPAGHQPDEVAGVLAAMDRYVAAISAKDAATMRAMHMPAGTAFRAASRADGGMQVSACPTREMIDDISDDGPRICERYWSPTVLVRGDLAVVWAPYEFQIDERTSHCGIDVFDFVREGGKWRVSNQAWTVEPSACAELRPTDSSVRLRP